MKLSYCASLISAMTKSRLGSSCSNKSLPSGKISLSGESSGEEQKTPAKREAQLERSLPKNFVKDQFAIWTSPAHVRTADSLWLVPFLGVTAGFIATDRAAVSNMPRAPNTVNSFKNISDYGLYGTAAFSGAMYLSGVIWKDPHKRETGWLMGEAVLNGLVVDTVLKEVTQRRRPFASSLQETLSRLSMRRRLLRQRQS